MLRWLCLCVLLASLTQSASAQSVWKAGVAKAVITPEKSVWLAGYGSKRAPDGKLHDLWMKALALEDNAGQRVVLITSDFQGVPKIMSDRVFEQLQEQFKLERTQVMFTFSHNHCGPRLGDDLIDYYPVEAEQEALVEEYTTQMVTKTVTMVGESLKNLAPASLAIGEGKATFAVNRRNNREADVPDLIAKGTPLVGPVDHAVPVMTVTRPDGKLEAVLFGYACHPTTMSFLTWCGDYPGFAQLEIEKAHPGTTAMFVNTCGGDQNPLPRRKVELAEQYGRMLTLSVDKVLASEMSPVSGAMTTRFREIPLEFSSIPSRDELAKTAESTDRYQRTRAKLFLKDVDAGKPLSPTYPYPIQVWKFGGVNWVALGGEVVVDYSLRLKLELGAGKTWVTGYANDVMAYIPSERVLIEGGYEGDSSMIVYMQPSKWKAGLEDQIVKTVHELSKP